MATFADRSTREPGLRAEQRFKLLRSHEFLATFVQHYAHVQRQMVFQLSHEMGARQVNKGELRAGHAGCTGIGKESVTDPHQLSHRAKWDTAEDTCCGGRGGAPCPGRGPKVAASKSATIRFRRRFHFFDVAHANGSRAGLHNTRDNLNNTDNTSLQRYR